MPNMVYHETKSPTSSAPVEMIAAVAANELGLPIFHLDVSQAFVRGSISWRGDVQASSSGMC